MQNKLLLAVCGIALIKIVVTAGETNGNETPSPDVGTARMFVEQGVAHFDKQEWNQAIRSFSEAIRLNPRDASAYRWRAGAYSVKGNLELAISDFGEAIRLNSTNAETYFNRAILYERVGNLANAISDLDQCVRLDPTNANAFAMRGSCFHRHRNSKRAIRDFEEAMRLDGGNPRTYNAFAWLRAACSDPSYRNGKEAVEMATKACELTGWKQWYCIDTLAAALAESGDFEKAVKYEKQAIEMSTAAPTEREAMEHRLSLYERREPYRETPQ